MAGLIEKTDRMILVLGVLVLALGVVVVAVVATNGFAPKPPSAEDRARAQVRRLVGPGAVVTYTETGRRLAVCGYLRQGGRVTAFVSRPNRLMLETDPLPTEFRQSQADLCPGFLRAPPARAAS